MSPSFQGFISVLGLRQGKLNGRLSCAVYRLDYGLTDKPLRILDRLKPRETGSEAEVRWGGRPFVGGSVLHGTVGLQNQLKYIPFRLYTALAQLH